MWYRWASFSDFDAWHRNVIRGLGLPRVGMNQQTKEPRPDKQATTAYTEVQEVGPGDWRAPVEPHVASQFPDGLGKPSSLPEVGVGWTVVDGQIVPPAPEPDVFTGDLL